MSRARLIVVAGVPLALAGLLALAYAALHNIPNVQTLAISAPICGTWNGVAWPNVGAGALQDVSAIGPDSAWAVGYQGRSYGSYRPLARRWDGTRWLDTAVPEIDGASSRLMGLAALADDGIWAVGDANDRTLTAHWDGRGWSILASPNVGPGYNSLYGVAAASTHDVWAVGMHEQSGRSQTLALHWDGQSWSIVPTPNVDPDQNELRALSVVSPDDVWAVGASGGQMLVMRWDGASWRLVPAPNHLAAPIALSDVAAISASDVWAVGAFMRELGPGVSVERAAALHWDGQRWAEVFVPSPPTSQRMAIRSIAAIATNDIWAVGDYGDGSDRAIALHWDGARWSLVAAPSVMAENRFTHLAANVQGTVWAVGSSDNREDGPNYALAAHFGPCPPAAAP